MVRRRLSRMFNAFFPAFFIGLLLFIFGLGSDFLKGDYSKYADYYFGICLLLIVFGIVNGLRHSVGPWLPQKYKLEDFVFKNKVPIKRRKYLALAALYSGNYETNECLKKFQLRTKKGNAEGREILEEYWGIKDAQTAKENLNWLRFEGQRNNEEFLNEQSRIIEQIKFPATRDEEINTLIENIGEIVVSTKNGVDEFIDPQIITDFKSIGAWDYIRGATVSKDCYNYGYLTEKEAWDYLITFSQSAKKEFDSWEQVAVSFLIGRYIWSGENVQEWYIDNFTWLFSNYEEKKIYNGRPRYNTWKKHQLSDM